MSTAKRRPQGGTGGAPETAGVDVELQGTPRELVTRCSSDPDAWCPLCASWAVEDGLVVELAFEAMPGCTRCVLRGRCVCQPVSPPGGRS